MDFKQFDNLAKSRLTHCDKLLTEKSKEYARHGDRLHNFKTAARIDDSTPYEALWVMWLKHITSIKDMVEDCSNGIYPNEKIIDDKISDMINYAILLEGLITEAKGGINEN